MSDESEPIRLVEDEETGDRFLVYSTERGLRIDIKFEGETLWMTQSQIAELFGRDRSTVTKHIGNIVEDGELTEQGNVQKTHFAQSTKPVSLYSLDMVVSVGYRVSSVQATLFRRWATGVLVQYAKKGFVVDAPRLKASGQADRIRELREIIRDIRSEEANLYAELRSICAMCQDYQADPEAARSFYQQTQAKLIFAVVSQTPSEVVASRADHAATDMGLQTWPNDNIRKADVTVAKNYLTNTEVRELNRLTSIMLDIFEDQLDLGRLVVMKDAAKLLDDQLAGLGRVVLNGGGRVSNDRARQHAQREYESYASKRKLERQGEANRLVAELAKNAKELPLTRS